MMPCVSVILPVYNRKDLLMRAVNSVFAQTACDFELIVINDGSTDGTASLDIFRQPPPMFTCISHPVCRGVAAARNTGCAIASGAWLAFLDSDDEWHPRKLERQLRWAADNPEYRILQTQEIWIRNGARVNPPATHEKICGWQFEKNCERCMITPSSVMLQKRLFDECGPFSEDYPACEDYDLWLRITARYPVGLVDEFLMTRFGGHADQLSATVPALDRFRVRSLAAIISSGRLSDEQAAAAKKILVKKAGILANGSKKRGNHADYEFYSALQREHQ